MRFHRRIPDHDFTFLRITQKTMEYKKSNHFGYNHASPRIKYVFVCVNDITQSTFIVSRLQILYVHGKESSSSSRSDERNGVLKHPCLGRIPIIQKRRTPILLHRQQILKLRSAPKSYLRSSLQKLLRSGCWARSKNLDETRYGGNQIRRLFVRGPHVEI